MIKGPTKIGKHNKISQFASIGEDPQDLKYAGERTTLEIGDNNVIREFVTLNRGTVQGGGVTRIGNNNLLMAYAHVAHDCIVNNHVIIANSVNLAGHVRVDDHCIIGGSAVVVQFARLGAYSFVSGLTQTIKDVPPYVLVSGHPCKQRGINIIGLRRHGFTESEIKNIKEAHKMLYRDGLLVEEAVEKISAMAAGDEKLKSFCDFLIEEAQVGIVR